MLWNRMHWLEDGVLPLLVVLMRVCWLWPWLQLLHRWLTPGYPDDLLSFWSIIALFLGGVLTARVSLQRASSLSRARLWAAAIGLTATLLVLWWHYGSTQFVLWDPRWLIRLVGALAYWSGEVSPPFLTFVVAAAVWLRGLLDGRAPITHEHVWDVFKFGFAALVLLLLAGNIDPAGWPPFTEQWIILFFAASMAALALSSLEISRHGRRPQGEAQLGLSRYWLVSVLSVVVILLLLGLLVGALISPEMLARGLGWIGRLLGYIALVIGYLMLLGAYLLFLLLTPIFNWLQSRFGGAFQLEPPQFGDTLERPEQLELQPGIEVPVAVVESSRWLGLAGMFILAVVVFALALRYFSGRKSESPGETRETILSRDLLQDQLSSLWNELWDHLRLGSRAKYSPFLSLEGVEAHREAIRALYQQLLLVARELGYPRAKIETPTEYQRTLESGLPVEPRALETMTDRYAQARYGPDTPSDEAVESTRSAWEKLRPALSYPQQEKKEEQRRDKP